MVVSIKGQKMLRCVGEAEAMRRRRSRALVLTPPHRFLLSLLPFASLPPTSTIRIPAHAPINFSSSELFSHRDRGGNPSMLRPTYARKDVRPLPRLPPPFLSPPVSSHHLRRAGSSDGVFLKNCELYHSWPTRSVKRRRVRRGRSTSWV